MSKFSAVSERMAEERKRDSDAADELMDKLDAHAKRRPLVVQKGHDWIKQELTNEIEAMDRGLDKMSNLIEGEKENPTPPSGGGGDASTKS